MSDLSDTFQLAFPTDTEIVMTRVFDAPRALVFEAMTRPEHVAKWWGSTDELDVELDFRVGGKWRFVERAPDGQNYAFHGEIREIVPGERVVQTFEFEGMPGHVLVETMRLTEEDGKTTVTTTSAFDTREERDGMVASGMEQGARASYDRLEALLATLG
ncbi:MAG: SRPBCC family protein [Hamadaea sp.]|nr:SRPBCC family protein [Hamadaea sp.]